MTADPTYLDEETEIENRVSDLLSRLSLKEKFKLLTSLGRHRLYTTKPIKRLKIPSFKMTDGPLGVAMHSSGFKKNTRFPATVALAATWNRNLMGEIGSTMGREVRAVGRHILLAPGLNIARTPLNGRTFEYFSEDPYLTKELAIPLVKGVQNQRIAACLKHYAANNQEIDRMTSSSEVDERTLNEIYLRAFRATVKEADPWSIMTCYNMVNGVYGCENKYLLQETLMDKWGFDGLVMTDWLASRKVKTTEGCINAGLTLEMPWSYRYNIKALRKAYESGEFTEETLDDRVRRNLRVMMLTGLFDNPEVLPKGTRNAPEHQNLARCVAEEGMVLLKNEGNILPLDIDNLKRISLHGPNLRKKFGKLLSGGSSGVSPPYEVTPLEGIAERCRGKVKLFPGDSLADVAIVFAGLNHGRGGDSESMDRISLHLDDKQVSKIKEVARNHQQTVVCIIAGSPIAMDEWIDDVEAVMMCWYGGMKAGNAIANVLFGDVNPSGKLPLTFPRRLEDSPAHSTGDPRNYPGDDEKRVYYEEGIYVGYRWFDKKEIDPLFPFGYGQSYTQFEFGNIQLNRQSIGKPEDELLVEVEVTNIGARAGSEVVQVYAKDVDASVDRPPQELVGFEKVGLGPGETKTVAVTVKGEDLGFYDVSKHEWTIEAGEFKLFVGSSSRDFHGDVDFSYL
ncbi:MAG: glycoside hydrolase family 3 C-terminal domain-containing protein [Candidatus Thorarchaeota archaeon]|nr:glycoside hydrolase family 3 C-terminal domain-containing protein [Candidatus Thorarchaeota archaeon]